MDLCASNRFLCRTEIVKLKPGSRGDELFYLLNMTCYSKLLQVGLSGSIHGKLLTRSSNIYWRWDSPYKECSLYSGRMLRETEGIIDTSRTVRSSDLLEVKVIQLKKVNRVENTPMYYLETGTRRLQDQTCATPSLK